MLKSSLLEIVRTFSKEELKGFEDFIRSPFFNKKENPVKLFLLIKKYAPDFVNKDLEKEKAWDAIFPGTEYNYGILKNLIFDLNKLLERYIITLKAGDDKLSHYRYLLSFMNERNLPKLFFNKFDSIEKTHNNRHFIDLNKQVDDYYYFWFEMLTIKHQVTHYADVDKKRSNDDSHLKFIMNFLINSFKQYQNLVVLNNGFNVNIANKPTAYFLKQLSPKSFDGILENIKKISAKDYLYLNIYYSMYCMFDKNNGDKYLKFKKLLFDNINLFSKKDLRDLHFCLINANEFADKAEINSPAEIISVFDSMISLNIFTEPNGVMAEHIFIFYVSQCFEVFDIDKINKFSDMFIGKLNTANRVNTGMYIKALNFYCEHKYDDSLNIISQIEPGYFVMKYYLRNFKGKCLYKINDYNLFLNEYDTLKHFIKNNKKINDRFRSRLEKFYYFINLLFKFRESFDEFEIAKLKTEAANFYKNKWNWIFVEIEKLENQNENVKVKS